MSAAAARADALAYARAPLGVRARARFLQGPRAGGAVAACLVALVALAVPCFAYADFLNIGEAINDAIENFLAPWIASLYDDANAHITGAIDSSALSASFNGLLGENGAIASIVLKLGDSVIKPCANTVLSMVYLIQLIKIASQMDKNGGMLPGVREVLVLFVTLAIMLALVNKGEVVAAGIFDLFQAIVGKFDSLLTSSAIQGMFKVDAQELKDAYNAGQLGFMWLVAIITWAAVLVACVLAQAMVLMRSVEVYVLTSFAPLPMAFLGVSELRSWTVGYFRAYLTVCLQGAVLVLLLHLMPLVFSTATFTPENPVGAIGAAVCMAFATWKSGALAGKILGGA